MAETVNDLQTLLDMLNEASRQTGLNINIYKTKWMVGGKSHTELAALIVGGNISEKVDRFEYLHNWLNTDSNCDQEF